MSEGSDDPEAGGESTDSTTRGYGQSASKRPTVSVGGDSAGTTREVESDVLLDPDSFLDNTLTVVVGIGGGIVVGLVGTVVLLFLTGSGWALLFGLFAWLGSTAHLVRRRTVQGAVSRSGYGVAIVLLLVPFAAVSPLVDVDGGLEGRITSFFVLLLFVAVPAGVAAIVGLVAGKYVPEDAGEGAE